MLNTTRKAISTATPLQLRLFEDIISWNETRLQKEMEELIAATSEERLEELFFNDVAYEIEHVFKKVNKNFTLPSLKQRLIELVYLWDQDTLLDKMILLGSALSDENIDDRYFGDIATSIEQAVGMLSRDTIKPPSFEELSRLFMSK